MCKKVEDLKLTTVKSRDLSVADNVIVYFKDAVIPEEQYNSWGGVQPSVNLDSELVVLVDFKKTSSYTYAKVYDSRANQKTVYFAKDKNMKVVNSPVHKAKAMAKFAKLAMKNMHNHLDHRSLGMSVGTDPEVFVSDGKGKLMPAFTFLNDKTNPNEQVAGNYPGRGVFWDGFQAEFDTYSDPCLAWVMDSVQIGLRSVMHYATKVDPDATLSMKTVVDVAPEVLENTEDKYLEFGCDPSLNAYSNGDGRPDEDGRHVPFRPAGGHIHFGFSDKEYRDEIQKDKHKNIVKALDAILGVACVSMFNKYDDPRRRSLYGKAGEYRLPEHGLEYRVLSNAWLCHPLMANLVFDLARKAFVVGYRGYLSNWKCSEEETIRIINEYDYKAARKVLTRNKGFMLAMLRATHNDAYSAEVRYKIFHRGADKYLKNPEDIVGNWQLNGQWRTHCDGDMKNWSYSRDYFKHNKYYDKIA